jgi:predicted flap endonuclease-1-like 5' DNA nuclease
VEDYLIDETGQRLVYATQDDISSIDLTHPGPSTLEGHLTDPDLPAPPAQENGAATPPPAENPSPNPIRKSLTVRRLTWQADGKWLARGDLISLTEGGVCLHAPDIGAVRVVNLTGNRYLALLQAGRLEVRPEQAPEQAPGQQPRHILEHFDGAEGRGLAFNATSSPDLEEAAEGKVSDLSTQLTDLTAQLDAAKSAAAAAPTAPAADPTIVTTLATERDGLAAQLKLLKSSLDTAADFRSGKLQPDDLLPIKGIGEVLNSRLNAYGVFTFKQIAQWTPSERTAFDALMDFPGRIEREEWQAQARALHKAKHGEDLA